MVNSFSILLGKILFFLSNRFSLGSGSTWPGHIALMINKNFSKDILEHSNTKKIIVAGTNGKTTTTKLIRTILEANGKTVLQNNAGANLENGLASTLSRGANLSGKLDYDYLIFESDEYALPLILNSMTPDHIVCLNLFRDQLDRYGELDSIARKWNESFKKLGKETTLILNSDDPLIAYLSNGLDVKSSYFGLSEKTKNELKHGADSLHCPNCQSKLTYKNVFFSHLGDWECPKCKLKRPKPDISDLLFFPASGVYNKYNALAAALLGMNEGLTKEEIIKGLKKFKPAFGRQETISYKDRDVVLFLSKNPTSFNESLSTVVEMGGNNVLMVLNDRIPDGLDVSWIWDINLEEILPKNMNIAVSGDRVYDMALRLKYADQFIHVEPDLESAINAMIDKLEEDEKLYILPNYSAMLDSRKILLGRKLL